MREMQEMVGISNRASGEMVLVRERKSKLAGRDAWADIPSYLRADIKKDFLDYQAKYQIDNLIGIYLVLDYGELISSLQYSGNVIPGKVVPAGSIQIAYYVPKAYGNEANYRSPVYIAPRYPRKSEMIELVTRLREICQGWDFELLSEIEDEEMVDYLQNNFRHSKMTTKDLNPRLARTIHKYLKSLFLRLDRAAVPIIKNFKKGPKFGAYHIDDDF